MLIIILLTALALLQNPAAFAADNLRIISVTGKGESDVLSDKWELRFDVQIKGENQGRVNSKYNQTKDKFLAFLKTHKISKESLTTGGFYSSEWQEWKNNSYVKKGWKIQQEFKIKTEDFEVLSKIVSGLTAIEDVKLGNINHMVKSETEKSLKTELYQKAYTDAMDKVKAILAASRTKMLKVLKISESSAQEQTFVAQQYKSSVRAMMDSSGSQADVALNPKKITQSVELVIQVEFK